MRIYIESVFVRTSEGVKLARLYSFLDLNKEVQLAVLINTNDEISWNLHHLDWLIYKLLEAAVEISFNHFHLH